ncbi:MAG: hypothetical protein GXP47_09380, partial [Acidobacteria bacterium]|nr:hypothetical protein [Acidobacteriota bacterium]
MNAGQCGGRRVTAVETILEPLGSPRQAAGASAGSAWLLVLAGALILGPFLAAAAVLRRLHPETFSWGAALLDPVNGAVSALLVVTAGAAATAA